MRVEITISFLIFFVFYVNYNMKLLTVKRLKHINLFNLKKINATQNHILIKQDLFLKNLFLSNFKYKYY